MKHWERTLNKIKNLESSLSTINHWKSEGKRIVFTNGCFDLLHLGHVEYLNKAAEKGDVLIVGLNTDDSVKRLKGETRPIQKLEARAAILASLECVSLVIPFADETPLKLIQTILPDVLVKGADYKAENIVGYTEVVANGGKVETVEIVEGYSTTNIIEKLKN